MRRPLVPCCLAIALLAAGCATGKAARPESATSRSVAPQRAGAPERKPAPQRKPTWEEGFASYYADRLHGRPTASGEPYDRNAATCAHRTHRFGTRLRVTNLATGRQVECRVNDRGPFVQGRVVDLSRALARELGLLEKGLARVRVQPVSSR